MNYKLSIITTFIIVFISSIMISNAEASNWTLLRSDNTVNEYYNKSNMIRISKNIKRVWMKTTWKDDSKHLRDRYTLFELNFHLKEWRVIYNLQYYKGRKGCPNFREAYTHSLSKYHSTYRWYVVLPEMFLKTSDDGDANVYIRAISKLFKVIRIR